MEAQNITQLGELSAPRKTPSGGRSPAREGVGSVMLMGARYGASGPFHITRME
jgi:hypothetical protein